MAIKKLQNDFTTPEQSKRLLELGVPADSADCYFLSKDGVTTWVRGVTDKHMNWMGSIDKTPLPCWSAGRLIEIIMRCHKQSILFFSSIRIYKTDILNNTIIDYLIKYMPNMDFSKLEE